MKKNRKHNMKKMYIDFIEKKICKNNAFYIFSYFFFFFMNVIGTIILIDWLNYQPPILYMVFKLMEKWIKAISEVRVVHLLKALKGNTRPFGAYLKVEKL